MNFFPQRIFATILVLLLFMPVYLAGQQVTDVDAAFQQARELASDGNYSDARDLSYAILEIAPRYHGVRVFIARTYAWENRFREARSELKKVTSTAPDYDEAHAAFADIEFWSGNLQPALLHITKAIQLQDDVPSYHIRRAQIHIELQQYSLAKKSLSRARSLDPGENRVSQLEDEIANIQQRNILAAGNRYDHFDNDLPSRNQLFVEYHRVTNRGPVIARLNYADRASLNEFQSEIEAYPTLNNKWYAYLNIGYSSGSLFPELSMSTEIYRTLPAAFELSLGLRYMKFSRDEVVIFTGSLSKYWKSWYFNLKPYLNTQDAGLTTSFNFTARKYFNDPETYLSFLGGFGFSADETRLAEGTTESRLLSSRYTGVRGFLRLTGHVQLLGELRITEQELPFTGSMFLIYTAETGIRYHF